MVIINDKIMRLKINQWQLESYEQIPLVTDSNADQIVTAGEQSTLGKVVSGIWGMVSGSKHQPIKDLEEDSYTLEKIKLEAGCTKFTKIAL